MRKHLFFISALFVSITASQLGAQTSGWTDDGTVVRLTNSSDNVGIGTAAPIGKFVLSTETAYSNLQFDLVAGGAAGDAVIRFGGYDGGVANYAASDVPWGIGVRRESNVFTLAYNAAGAANLETGQVMSVLASGNVGIGTVNPTSRLDILNALKLDEESNIPAEGSIHEGNWNSYILGGLGTSRALRMGVVNDWFTRAEIEIENNNSWNGTIYFKTAWGDGGAQTRMTITGNGRVGIGTTNPVTELHVEGTTRTKVIQITGGADIAEPFNITGDSSIEPGMVVSIDPDQIGQLRVSGQAYDRTVAGIISGAGGVNPGIIMAQSGTEADGEYPVALTGRVYAWADATNGPIKPGDLLTTSSTPGHAMKVSDFSLGQGAIIGKAMSRLDEGKGLVLVLISLQ